MCNAAKPTTALLNLLNVISVDEYLQLFHSNVFQGAPMMRAQSHFNVITCFYVQCSSEPRPTTIAASTPASASL